MKKRIHVAAVFEFAVPLVFSVLFLRVATMALGPEPAGLLLVFATISSFAVGLDVMGGRALSGFVSRLPPEHAIGFILSKIRHAVVSAALVGIVTFAAYMNYLKDFPRETAFDGPLTAASFSISTILSQISNYVLWSRLGLGLSGARSATIIVGNLIAGLALLALLLLHQPSIWLFSLPFLVRDASCFGIGALWLNRISISQDHLSRVDYPDFKTVAASTVGLNLVTVLFEPLSKIIFAKIAGFSSMPALDLTMRGLSAVRNGLVIFTQTYTDKLAGERADELVQRLEAVCLAVSLGAISAGWIAMRSLGPHIVGASADDLGAIYGALCVAVGLNACLTPRYLQLYVQGRIARLAIVHASQAVLPVLVFLFGLANTQEEILSALSMAYLIGAMLIVVVSAGPRWFAGSRIASISILVAAAGCCYSALFPHASLSGSMLDAFAVVTMLTGFTLAVFAYRRLLTTILVK